MTNTESQGYAAWIPVGIVAFGLGCLLLDVAAGLFFRGTSYFLTTVALLGNLLTLTFCLGIVAAGYWLHRSDLSVAHYPRIAAWIAVFSVSFLAVNLILIGLLPTGSLYADLAWALFAVYVGGAGGVVVGIVEARAVSRAVEAERAAVEAERAATHRKWLDYLNGLLRHEVLNNASIIQGYATLLLEEEGEDLPPAVRDHLETIRHQSEDMTDVVQDVRILIHAVDRTDGFAPVDVEAVLEAELEDLRKTYRDVETDLAVDGDGDAYVLADDLLPRVFSNLFTNAVEHNAGGTPRVEVTVETTPEVVAVDVADDGLGISESDRERLFERGVGDHGHGLYLVGELLDRYGGTIELADTGPEGSAFTVELPRTDPPDGG